MPASSSPRAAFLALSTSGWSNGLMPSSRPATAVATSQSSSWAPSAPPTWTSEPRSPDASAAVGRVVVGGDEARHGDVGGRGAPRGRCRRRRRAGRRCRSCRCYSAISCSAQSAKPTMPDPSSTSTSLSRSGVGAGHRGAEAQAGVGLVVRGEQVGDRLGLVEQGLDVGSGQAARHQPEGGQRGVAATDVGVGVDDPVAGGAGLLVERAAGVGHDDDARGRVDARPR